MKGAETCEVSINLQRCIPQSSLVWIHYPDTKNTTASSVKLWCWWCILWMTDGFDRLNSSWRMATSGMLCYVTSVGNDVSEERSASFIRVTRIGELGTLAVTSNWRMLRRNARFLFHWFLSLWWRRRYVPPKRRFLQEPQWRNIPEDAILHSHHHEYLKSYTIKEFVYERENGDGENRNEETGGRRKKKWLEVSI
jgi:hypothetical protein